MGYRACMGSNYKLILKIFNLLFSYLVYYHYGYITIYHYKYLVI